ncbi:Maleylpyruvate isomerase [Pelagimonas phthalicica]|uniref:Maleylpyruvate isomerase n=1 Tax=Pelagimonas phthalicica TaxID=1037362 RepID=A0A238J6V2_9RHOB|nr:maleylacetoacetate isomerase [Pelagimonas phthalicica]TDS95403.1 maleylacetoacetate isomerase [Pelagimonas phthalicica]SMX26073.1 Maleylpyruvate isomerase [Pelagimonas phthalicica]
MTILYDYWRSSASYRVRIALGLAGEDWQGVSVDLLQGAHKSQDHLARNPQGLVPALEIDGVTLTQSVAITEYLNETRHLGLLPDDPIKRAQVRAISQAIAMEIHPVCNLNVAKFATAQSDGKMSMQDWMQHFITPGLAAVEEMVTGARFCFGDRVSLADICLMPQLYNAQRWEIDLSPMPKLRGIHDNLSQIPAFAAAHPDRVKP